MVNIDIMKKKWFIGLAFVIAYSLLLIFVPLIGKNNKRKTNNYKTITYIENMNINSIKDICNIGNYEVVSKWDNSLFEYLNSLNIKPIALVSHIDELNDINDKYVSAYYIDDYISISNCIDVINNIKKISKKETIVHCSAEEYDCIDKIANYYVVEPLECDRFNINDEKIIVEYECKINNWYSAYNEFLKSKKSNNNKWSIIIKIAYE
jgi:hypothetical protein